MSEPRAEELLQQHWAALLQGYEGAKRDQVAEAQRVLVEALGRLRRRYEEVVRTSEAFLKLGTPDYAGPFIGDLQTALVDTTEAFHQGAYSVVSDLALVLSHRSRAGERQVPTRRNTDFLTYLDKVHLADDPAVPAVVAQVRQSTEYRAVFVDHRQQHKLYNWMTGRRPRPGGEGVEAYVVYYRVLPKEATAASALKARLPTGEEVFFPVATDEVIPAPDVDVTYAALQHLVLRALGFVEANALRPV